MTSSNREPQRPNGDEVIWRYMSVEKFKDLFLVFNDHDSWTMPSTNTVFRVQPPGRLWFSLPRAFESYWEGRLPTANESAYDYCIRMATTDALSDEEFQIRLDRLQSPAAQIIRECNLAFARLCGVSCWTQNAPGTVGMWTFSAGSPGIAVRSTVDRVLNGISHALGVPACSHRLSATRVGYVDHQSWLLKADGYRNILACVNIEEDGENEIRFIAKSPRLARIVTRIPVETFPLQDTPVLELQQKQAHLENILLEANAAITSYLNEGSNGFHLPLNLEDLIDQVVSDSGEVFDDVFEASRQL